jgi:hypothetical protein
MLRRSNPYKLRKEWILFPFLWDSTPLSSTMKPLIAIIKEK